MINEGLCQACRTLTITSKNKEFIFFGNVMAGNIRIGGDYLSLDAEGIVFLEFEITESAGESEIAWRNGAIRSSRGEDVNKIRPLTRPNST